MAAPGAAADARASLAAVRLSASMISEAELRPLLNARGLGSFTQPGSALSRLSCALLC